MRDSDEALYHQTRQTHTKAKEEGYKARQLNQGVSECPYELKDERRHHWLSGYQQATAFILARKKAKQPKRWR